MSKFVQIPECFEAAAVADVNY